jgi:serralysin
MPTTQFTSAEAAVQLTREGISWAGTQITNTPVNVTFGFRESSLTPDFEQSTAAQKAAFQMALSLFSDVANITFTAVNAAGFTNDATMLFSSYLRPGDGQAGYSNGLTGPYPEANHEDGDVWINLAYGSATSVPMGSYDFKTILHEIGHAIGLAHPGDYNGDAVGALTYQANAGYVQDSRQFSMMSYFEAYETGAFHYSSAAGGVQYASTLLLHDIAALQRLYGVNTTTRTGDTIYGFNSTAGLDSFDFTKNKGPVIAIWDAGGAHDTLDTSGYSLNQIINLQAGAFSDVGGMRKNVAIAEGTTLENAIGGNADDTMSGNAAANVLDGNGGWDTLSGLAGNDMLQGDDGNDKLDGGANDDKIYGGNGNDELAGGTGIDVLNGGAGDDTMTGGDGSDGYYVDSDLDYVVETNSLAATGGSDYVFSTVSFWLGDNIEKLYLSGSSAIIGWGNMLANSIAGNGAANTLYGLEGNDYLNGGAGNDTLFGGGGRDTFIFNSALSTTRNRDKIADFSAADDTIRLENAVFNKLGTATGALGSAKFWASTKGIAHDADDRILYNTVTGVLAYDADGNKVGGVAAVQFAVLTAHPLISVADFTII